MVGGGPMQWKSPARFFASRNQAVFHHFRGWGKIGSNFAGPGKGPDPITPPRKPTSGEQALADGSASITKG